METNTNPLYQLYHQFHTTCQHTFNLTAHGWQAAIGAKILHAVSIKKAIKCLCVKPTGGGKSLIFNVVATILKGVTICICPLLSLGANQTKKTLALVDTPSPAPVTAFHLDEMKLKSLHKLKRILRDERSNGTAVIIYTSPQALNGVKGNSIVIPFLIRGNLIRLVVLDEIHLVSSFGNTFTKEFGTLPATLFSKLNIDCPMLFLTATCTAAIRCDFESLMQLEINQWQWPSPNKMMHRIYHQTISTCDENIQIHDIQFGFRTRLDVPFESTDEVYCLFKYKGAHP
jgi:superfamily II DNA helicase RecQ